MVLESNRTNHRSINVKTGFEEAKMIPKSSNQYSDCAENDAYQNENVSFTNINADSDLENESKSSSEFDTISETSISSESYANSSSQENDRSGTNFNNMKFNTILRENGLL